MTLTYRDYLEQALEFSEAELDMPMQVGTPDGFYRVKAIHHELEVKDLGRNTLILDCNPPLINGKTAEELCYGEKKLKK